MADKKVTTNKTTPAKNTATQKKTTAAKPAADKSAAKAAPATSAKAVTAKAKQTTTATKPAAKPSATAKTTATAKPVAKPSTTATPAKLVAKTPAPAAKPSATAKTTATPKPVAKTTVKPTAKPTAKTEKTTKNTRTVADSGTENKSGFAAFTQKVGATATAVAKKLGARNIAIIGASIVCALCLIIGISVGVSSCNKNKIKPFIPYDEISVGEETFFTADKITQYNFDYNYAGTTLVGYYTEEIGTVERNVPEKTRDEGLPAYPTYGYTLRDVIGTDAAKVAARTALISESAYLAAFGTAGVNRGLPAGITEGTPAYEEYMKSRYTWMDENGWLWRGTVTDPIATLDDTNHQRRLYKHSASVGLYLGDVSPDEPGIIKRVTMRARSYGYGVTGVYAPAGEVIKIIISERDMNATGGIAVHIGQALYNGQANNIWESKNQMQRIPHVLNTLFLNKTTTTYDEENHVYVGYVGSFLGGPLYIRNHGSVEFSAIISGGVRYKHFILGYTTKDEFDLNATSSAPYFDLEVWNNGVLHSGPKNYVKSFSFDDLYEAAVLWEKISLVSTYRSSQGIVFLYDPFVAAGAAVAFPGRSSVNCPLGWMTQSLNYSSFVSSGSWGNVHEYNHNFQGYGCGYTGEVTNNALSLVSYSLFTKISQARQIGSYGGAGLGGWNCYTSASWALQRVIDNQITSTNGLAVYATFLHNFGQNAFMQASVGQGAFAPSGSGISNDTAYFLKFGDVVHQDMSYYEKLVHAYSTNGDSTKIHQAQSSYPMFVPVSCVYQTGRSYNYNGEKKEITTMQPYIIRAGDAFTIDLNRYTTEDGQYRSGSIILPNGINYTITNVDSSHLNGTLVNNGDGTYLFTPGSTSIVKSGKLKVTLHLEQTAEHIATYGAFTMDDVELTLEFEQSYAATRNLLQRTTYTYAAGSAYTDAVAAYEANFAGYESVIEAADHRNPTQNCNTDIWYYPAGTTEANKLPYVVPSNSVAVVEGKLRIEDTGKYRIALRGRHNCAMYLSTDGGATYFLAGRINDASTTDKFRLNDPNTYTDLELSAGDWVYFKEILITTSTPSTCYIGMGIAEWTIPMYTAKVDANGDPVYGDDGNPLFVDGNGNTVTAEQANNTAPIEPASVGYATGYRANYDAEAEAAAAAKFTSEYMFKRSFTYSYQDTHTCENSSIVENSPVASGEANVIENILDGNKATAAHSLNIPSASSPWSVTVDLGKTITANAFTMTGWLNNGAGNQNQTPNNYVLYLGETAENLQPVATVVNGRLNNVNVISSITTSFTFTKQSFRFYKIDVTGTVQGRYMRISTISFSILLPGGKMLSPDDTDRFTYSTSNWICRQEMASFGHTYVGKTGSEVSFNFSGTRFALLTPQAFKNGRNYKVYVDGVLIDYESVKENNTDYAVVDYLSTVIASGQHTVRIVCNGEFHLDSVVVWA